MKGSPFTSAETAKAFVVAGDAVFTFRSRKSDRWYTYKVEAPKDDARKRFVFVLAHGDRYAYLGMLRKEPFSENWTGLILTPKSKFTTGATVVKAFNYGWDALRENPPRLAEHLDVFHEGKCGCCGRALTVPGSIESGIGPVCSGRT